MKKGKKTHKPGSVLGNHLSGLPLFRDGIERPTRRTKKRTAFAPLFRVRPSYLVLHRTGFSRRALLPGHAVGSYPTISLLTLIPDCSGFRADFSLLHFPSEGGPEGTTLIPYSSQGVVSSGARTFLPDNEVEAITQPSFPLSVSIYNEIINYIKKIGVWKIINGYIQGYYDKFTGKFVNY